MEVDEGGERSYPKVVAMPEPTRVHTDLFFSMARDVKKRRVRENGRVAMRGNETDRKSWTYLIYLPDNAA